MIDERIDPRVKSWPARRKALVAMDLIRGTTSAVEVARKHALSVSEVDSWLEKFIRGGKESLAPNRVGCLARENELLAKIGELTMQLEHCKRAEHRALADRRRLGIVVVDEASLENHSHGY